MSSFGSWIELDSTRAARPKRHDQTDRFTLKCARSLTCAAALLVTITLLVFTLFCEKLSLSPWNVLTIYQTRAGQHEPWQGPDVFDVFILAGQSNMVGENRADGATGWPADVNGTLTAPPSGRLVYFPVQQQWLRARLWKDVPVGSSVGFASVQSRVDNALGPEIAFAYALLGNGTSRRVGLIPTAVGATSLHRDWRADMPMGYAYRQMVSTVHAAFSTLKKHNENANLTLGSTEGWTGSGIPLGPYRLRGILWVQGESDADVPKAHMAAAYYDNLVTFIRNVRAELAEYTRIQPPVHGQFASASDAGTSSEGSELAVVLAAQSLQNRQSIMPHIGRVREAQLRAARELDNVAVADMEGAEFYFEHFPRHPDSWLHLSKQGACTLGFRMAEAFRSLVQRGTGGAGGEGGAQP